MNWQTFEYRVTDFLILLFLLISMTLAYTPRFKKPVTWLAVLGMTVLGSVLIVLQEQISFGIFWLYLAMFVLTGGIYASVFLQGQFWPKFAMVCVYCSSYFLINRAINNIILILCNGQHILGMRYAAQPAVFASGVFLYKHAIRTKQRVPTIYPLLIALVSFLCLVMISTNSMLNVSTISTSPYGKHLQQIVYSLSLLAITYITFWLAHSLIRRHESTRLQVSLTSRRQADRQMALESERLRREMHLLRHEINNQLSTLAALLDQGNTVRARTMLDEVCSALPAPSDEIHSGNSVSDAVLNQKIAQARAQGVTVTADVCMDRSQAIRDTDLAALLSNLLNNALEASVQVSQPLLDVHIYPAKGYLCISIRNRADMDALRRNPLLQTTKKHPEAHGLGLEIVRQIVDRYHGVATFNAEEEGFFVAQVMLSLDDGNVSRA